VLLRSKMNLLLLLLPPAIIAHALQWPAGAVFVLSLLPLCSLAEVRKCTTALWHRPCITALQVCLMVLLYISKSSNNSSSHFCHSHAQQNALHMKGLAVHHTDGVGQRQLVLLESVHIDTFLVFT
jgi:hypothetical protein